MKWQHHCYIYKESTLQCILSQYMLEMHTIYNPIILFSYRRIYTQNNRYRKFLPLFCAHFLRLLLIFFEGFHKCRVMQSYVTYSHVEFSSYNFWSIVILTKSYWLRESVSQQHNLEISSESIVSWLLPQFIQSFLIPQLLM